MADHVIGEKEHTHGSIPALSTEAAASMQKSQIKQWNVNCAGVAMYRCKPWAVQVATR